MAMSLEQTLTVEANTNESEVRADNTAMPVTPSPSGEHAAELTPNAELAESMGDLTIDTYVETVVPSPVRRASKSDRCLTSKRSLSSTQEQICYSMNCRRFNEPKTSSINQGKLGLPQ